MSYYSILNRCFLNIKKLMLHKTAIVTFMFIALLFSWFAGHIVVGEKEIVFPVMIKTSTTCQTTTTANQNQLIVFTPSKYVAQLLTQNLCDDKVVAKQYGSVIGYWGYRTVDSLEFVGKGIADLILAKNNIMEAFRAETTYNYQPVVGFSDYTAFFISSKEKPLITKQYFLDKRIGLLDYPTSRSGHILPKQTFKQLGLNIAQLKITYASSHNELRELLANGQVDLIASFWRENDSKRFSKNYITPISSNVAGTRWYLKMQHNNTDLLCAVQSHLLSMSKEQSFRYYQDVEPYWQCNNYPVTFIGES